jgi:hypothetical protein
MTYLFVFLTFSHFNDVDVHLTILHPKFRRPLLCIHVHPLSHHRSSLLSCVSIVSHPLNTDFLTLFA